MHDDRRQTRVTDRKTNQTKKKENEPRTKNHYGTWYLVWVMWWHVQCWQLTLDTLCCLLFIFIDFDKEIWRNLWWKISTVSWSHDRTKTDAAHKYFVSKKFLDFGTFDFSSTYEFNSSHQKIPFHFNDRMLNVCLFTYHQGYRDM